MKPKRPRELDAFALRVGSEELVVISLPGRQRVALDELTRAEREVAADVIAGLSNVAIARRRRRSPRTVANQLASIYRKLGVGSRAELAARLGL